MKRSLALLRLALLGLLSAAAPAASTSSAEAPYAAAAPAAPKPDAAAAPAPKPAEAPKPDDAAKPGPDVPYGAKIAPVYPKNPFDIRGDDIDKGGDVSKACRYDEPEWSNCDPFELIRFRTLHLVSGGRQCEEVKNITEKCTPYDLPPGTKWLINEHRRCIAELKRLKIMIADLAKYITTLREKGQYLFNSYLALKKHLDQLRTQIDGLQRQLEAGSKKITSLRSELENWKEKARTLQTQLDEMRASYHDLQKEHKECGVKQKECHSGVTRCKSEIVRLRAKLHTATVVNSELKRRLMDAEKYKDQLKEVKAEATKLEAKSEKLKDKMESVTDVIAQCKIDYLNANSLQEDLSYKDTHMDLSMEMWITHNRSDYTYSTTQYTVPTTPYPGYGAYEQQAESPKCLVSYYGYTNETCWYSSETESVEAEAQDAVGSHLVEAHWKYFTIDVKDQYDCDKAAHLHYEFLINRCKPKHYLPVLSIYRYNSSSQELGTHIYPKPNIPQPGKNNRCWITFLGPHGQCERRKDKYGYYNSDDTVEGYRHSGAGVSKSKCLERAKTWSDYCETPCIATYIPEGVSSNWQEGDIQHDNHGGRMFEEKSQVKKIINPNSMNPNNYKPPPSGYAPEEYEDTPEYRKSLNMRGQEREEILKKLRDRLGMTAPKKYAGPGGNKNVKWQGVNGEHGSVAVYPYGGAAAAPAKAYEAPAAPAKAYEAPAATTKAYEAPTKAYEAPAATTKAYEAPAATTKAYEAPAPAKAKAY